MVGKVQPAAVGVHQIFPNEGERTMSDKKHKSIVGVHRMNETAVLVEYSDNSSAIYTASQLSGLVPIELTPGNEIDRESVEKYERNVLQFPSAKCRVANRI
jgi:uncharacterized protein YukJ